MKLFFLIISSVFAQAEGTLEDAFQREYVFLATQKEALSRQRALEESRYRDRKTALEREIKSLEKNLVAVTSKNEEVYEQLQGYEKEKRDYTSRTAALEGTLKKMLKLVKDVDSSLRFEAPEKFEPILPSIVTIGSFADLRRQSQEALKNSVSVDSQTAAYLDKAGNLTRGEVLRYGRVAAQAVRGGDRFVLGPDGQGNLQEVDTAPKSGELSPIYAFESLLEKAVVKKNSGIFDHMADLAPAVLLAALFAMVGFLFTLLARE